MSDQQAGMASQAHQPFADKLARAKAKGVTLATRIHLPEAAAASFRLDGVERALRRLDIPVRVLTSQPPADGPKPEDPQGVSVSRWPVLRDKSGYLRGYVPYMSFDLPLFGRLLAAKKPAVLLVEPPPTTGVVVRAVTTLRRIPLRVVRPLTCGVTPRFLPGSARRWLRLCSLWSLSRCGGLRL